jgi:ATP-dependent DNA ligase
MQPELAPEPFHRPGWIYEEKLDWWRMIAYKDGPPRVRLVSRTGMDHTARFPEIAAAVAGLALFGAPLAHEDQQCGRATPRCGCRSR